MTVNEQTVQRLLHPVDDARHALGGISRATFYEMVKDGRIHLTKIGRRSFVSDPELKRAAGVAACWLLIFFAAFALPLVGWAIA